MGYMKWQGYNPTMSLTELAPVEGMIAAIWKDQCWNMGVSFYSEKYIDMATAARKPEREYTVELIFTLKGLGESGLSIYNFVQDY
jgi:hypothetical protein